MAQLVVKNSNDHAENFALNRLRTTIGRSARSDLCIPDAFASRLHAEVRKEGDCGGCRMRVPPQLITQIHRNSDVVFCPNCQRILYVLLADQRASKEASKVEA